VTGPPDASAARPPRSVLVTVVAWAVLLAGALVTPLSAITLLMLLAGSHGTQNATVGGALGMVAGPPLAAVAGFGMWRRWRWAYVCVLALLAAFALWNVARIVAGPTPARTEISPGGVPTHVSASEVDVPWHAAVTVLSLGVMAALLRRSVRAELAAARPVRPAPAATPGARASARAPQPRDDARAWRTGHEGRDGMYYEERHAGRWRRIRIDGEMLTGRAHHVIYFASPDRWLDYPAWARDRRDEIIARIKSDLRPPDYEYVGDQRAQGNGSTPG